MLILALFSWTSPQLSLRTRRAIVGLALAIALLISRSSTVFFSLVLIAALNIPTVFQILPKHLAISFLLLAAAFAVILAHAGGFLGEERFIHLVSLLRTDSLLVIRRYLNPHSLLLCILY